MNVASSRTLRLPRWSASRFSRCGIQFLRRVSFGGLLTGSILVANDASAQVVIPPTASGTAGETTSSFGNQSITINAGGTLNLAGLGTLVNNQLRVRFYDEEFGAGLLNPISNLINSTAEGDEQWTGPIDFPDETALLAASTTAALTSGDTFSILWTGLMNISAGGSHFFETRSDDGSVWWIDLNRDGAFGSGELIVDNNGDHGDITLSRTISNLAPGAYPIAIAMYENGGGTLMQAQFRRPADGADLFVDPSDPAQNNLWSSVQNQTNNSNFSANAVTVNGNATINVDRLRAERTTIGPVTVARGATLTTDGGPLSTASTTVPSTGTGGVTFAGTGRFDPGSLVTNGAPITVNTSGTGALVLTNSAGSNVTGSTFNVQSGTLSVRTAGNTSPLGNAPLTLSGGTLSLDGTVLPQSPTSANGLGWSALDSKAGFDAALAGIGPLATRSLDNPEREINFPRGDGNLNDGGGNDEDDLIYNRDGGLLNVPLSGNDDHIARFTGKLNVTAAGPTEFGLGSNDGATMFLDLDTGPAANWVKVADNNRIGPPVTPAGMEFRGTVSSGAVTFGAGTPAIAQPAVPNLSAGTYDFIVGYFNLASTDQAGIEVYWTPSGGTGGIIPASSMAMLNGEFYAGAVLNNAITVTANSTIDVASRAGAVTALTINPGVTLSKTGNDLSANITVGGAGTATVNVVSGQMSTQTISMPAGSSLAKTGSGELVIGQLAPTTLGAGTSLDARGGRLTAVAGSAGDSLGDSLVTLSGGTLGVRGDGTLPTVPVGPGLADVTGKFYQDGLVFDQNVTAGRTDPGSNGWSAFASVPAMDAALNPLTPAFNNVPINVPLNFPGDPANLGDGGNDDEGGNIFGASGIGVNLGNAPDINFAVRFAGKLNVSQAGRTGFNVGSNSGAVMFLDVDQGPGTNWQMVVDNNRYGGGDGDNYINRGSGDPDDPPITQIPAPILAAGTYDFMVGFFGHNDESDGLPVPTNNEAGVEVRWTPAGGGESIIPVAARGSALTFGNNIQVTENSTVDIGTAVSAAFGNINVNAGRTLTSTGGARTGGLVVTGSVDGAGTLQAGANATVQFTKSGAASSGTPTLDIEGGGTMRFAPGSGNTFGGNAVAAVTNDGLLHAANGVTDLSDAVVTTPNPGGAPVGAGLAGVTGRFYRNGLVFNQNFTTGRSDPSANGWSAFGSVAAMDAALGPLTPAFNNVPINVPLNFPGDPLNLGDGGNDDEGGNIFAQSGIGVDLGNAPDINFAARFAGKLNVTQSGPTAFSIGSNSGGVMFLDLDTGPGTNWATVVDNNRYGGGDGANFATRGSNNPGAPAINQLPAQNLTAGVYDFIVGFFGHNDESDGLPVPGNNEAGVEVRWTPAGGGESIIPASALSAPSIVQVDSGATLRLGTLVDIPNLSLAPTGRLELRKGTSRLNASVLNIPGGPGAATATVDLTDARLAVQSSAATKTADFNALYADVKQGFNEGTWMGLGITSSTAATNPSTDTGVTVVDNALLGLTDFGGRPVDANSILLKYTYYGDIDQNGQVDADDLTVFASNFGRTSGATQVDGDIDFNGAVNADDLTVFANNFNKGVGAPLEAAAAGVQAVPEPGSLVLAGLGAAGILTGIALRRNRRTGS